MPPSSSRFVREKFVEFLKQHSSSISPSASIESRKFGFLLFKESIALRHEDFKDVDNLMSFLKMAVPFDVYCSIGHYLWSEVEMREKGWLGTNLIFYIDVDHILSSCPKIHEMRRAQLLDS